MGNGVWSNRFRLEHPDRGNLDLVERAEAEVIIARLQAALEAERERPPDYQALCNVRDSGDIHLMDAFDKELDNVWAQRWHVWYGTLRRGESWRVYQLGDFAAAAEIAKAQTVGDSAV